MIILFVILGLIALLSVRLNTGGHWNVDYMSKDTGNVIKGICIWLVFIRHISSYMCDIPGLNLWDQLLYYVDSYVRQLLVVPFLFYSGYGVTISIIQKGDAYANNIPLKRVLPTLLYFDIAVFIFLMMNLALGFELSLSQVLLAFTGWDSIRNSNWYIFCIIICYLISWISYKSSKGDANRMIVCVWIGILLYTAILYFFKGHWWYDTIYAYGAGVTFACKRERLEILIQRYYKLLLLGSLIGFMIFYNVPNYFCIPADITAVFICVILVLFTSRVRLQSRILSWSGSHLFPLYIYQRLPMVIFSTIYGGEFMEQHYYLYIICCLVITVLIAYLYGNPRFSFVKYLAKCHQKKA